MLLKSLLRKMNPQKNKASLIDRLNIMSITKPYDRETVKLTIELLNRIALYAKTTDKELHQKAEAWDNLKLGLRDISDAFEGTEEYGKVYSWMEDKENSWR